MLTKVLLYKKCKIENCDKHSISVGGGNPYCRDHVSFLCELKHETNIFNECRCNSSVSMVELENKSYCNAHYRKLIQTCNQKKCKTLRTNNILSFDKKWYCKNHKPNNEKLLAKLFLTFRGKLPPEITEKIYKIHLKNNTYVL